jgi:hypothetical protein
MKFKKNSKARPEIKVSAKVAIATAKAEEQAKLCNKKYIICPICHQFISEENWNRHERRSANCKEMIAELNAQNERRVACKKRIEERKKLGESRLGSLVHNKQINEFLRKNPVNNKMGGFGVPQDKYRYGFYGNSTMEYDIWRKGDK